MQNVINFKMTQLFKVYALRRVGEIEPRRRGTLEHALLLCYRPFLLVPKVQNVSKGYPHIEQAPFCTGHTPLLKTVLLFHTVKNVSKGAQHIKQAPFFTGHAPLFKTVLLFSLIQ